MKKQSQNINSAGQSPVNVKTSQKHEVNLQKNSTLYFQIGLILCLLGTHALFEMQFESNAIAMVQPEIDDDTIEITIDKVVEQKTEVKLEPVQKKIIKLNDVYVTKEDDFKDLKEELLTPDETEPISEPLEPGDSDLDIDNPVDDDIIVPFVAIEYVPVYPGCEKFKTNSKKKKCMSDKIAKLVQKKFNTELASECGLSGVQKIYAQFKIDKNGQVIDIQSRAPHPKLEEEASRVLNIIPKMQPGIQKDKPVTVSYSLPIKFKVEN
ncbi:MAG: energy transducer TonB [Winogradskyella sp.]|uniref:energy transducer TonB n=1 Tax=Winogradskyella sp. TaxID=1883156 RepID=UPI000F3D51BB|nr:energy transducer TonB [Winogradskyella sp.]RNC84314.1 MAG: energy transducer TonB [Winogradskyella sp.]